MGSSDYVVSGTFPSLPRKKSDLDPYLLTNVSRRCDVRDDGPPLTPQRGVLATLVSYTAVWAGLRTVNILACKEDG